jgi:hypothetical protein
MFPGEETVERRETMVEKVKYVRNLPVGKQQAVVRVLVRQSPRRTMYLFHHPLERPGAQDSP